MKEKLLFFGNLFNRVVRLNPSTGSGDRAKLSLPEPYHSVFLERAAEEFWIPLETKLQKKWFHCSTLSIIFHIFAPPAGDLSAFLSEEAGESALICRQFRGTVFAARWAGLPAKMCRLLGLQLFQGFSAV